MRVEFHPEANDEFVEEAAYYEQKIPGLGASFIAEFESVKTMLEAHPKIGAEIALPFRCLPMRRFPHSLIYSIEVDCIWIIAVAHQKRQPGYWRERIERE